MQVTLVLAEALLEPSFEEISMDSLELPNVIYKDDDQKHKTIDLLSTLTNLLYLIRLDAANPALVESYVEQSEETLQTMLNHLAPNGV